MMTSISKMLVLGACLTFPALADVLPPEPYGAVPSERQLKWHQLETYAFVHFTTNTFTDKEWGFGDESPEVFNPTDFDADQIVRTLKAGGMKGLILTAKHHDGFCLWPSAYTEHSVKNSPYKDGEGDIVKEISDACRKHGLKFGVYLSPWDRNHKDYGRPEYIEYFRNQLTELLSNYGEVFEVWFDGANGGTGYYGGDRGERKIDRSTYYDWENTWQIVRELQPDAVIFSDVGPDVRWVGNEHGEAGLPCWATYRPESNQPGKNPAPGVVKYKQGFNGHKDGQWLPAEVDVSIRPGWFYHAHENAKVRSVENLLKLYYESVGRGASLNLNVPPDWRGQIPAMDAMILEAFQRSVSETFAVDLAQGAEVTASDSRGEGFGVGYLVDQDGATYWSTADGRKKNQVVMEFEEPIEFDLISMREYLPLGQRVHEWSISYENEQGDWVRFAQGQSIGARKVWRGQTMSVEKLRFDFNGPVAPALSEISIHRQKIYPVDVRYPELSLVDKTGWKVVAVSAESPDGPAAQGIDGNSATLWHTHLGDRESGVPQFVTIDLGDVTEIKGVNYLPRQDGSHSGVVTHYRVMLSEDGENWEEAAVGEFGNIAANPIMQNVMFGDPVRTRFIRFHALKVLEGEHVTAAEIGIVK
ncbi:alpha-L-fucosidase [Sulfuriroseicoccus oceanibius]|uniref:alpha-L-fucosidase n=1 Tax=Sulfuriroseicoccus oceanibius TaxID=2707525 RepID=A0A6B3L5R1_9BACT|nr:alpha-L-fucosidase [Sulfuriroseicoccus oceanibius]QQL45255.1 alpha-L-fucosidase [Sulfuriroseicoccus oceanibius]